jgi:hypothetical protein
MSVPYTTRRLRALAELLDALPPLRTDEPLDIVAAGDITISPWPGVSSHRRAEWLAQICAASGRGYRALDARIRTDNHPWQGWYYQVELVYTTWLGPRGGSETRIRARIVDHLSRAPGEFWARVDEIRAEQTTPPTDRAPEPAAAVPASTLF